VNTRIISLFCLALSAAAQPPDCAEAKVLVQERFAKNVELHPGAKPCRISGDFDGDGIADHAFLVRLKSDIAALPKNVTLVNPWSRQSGRMPGRGDLAIAVAPGAASLMSFLIGDKEMLSTPMWQTPENLISAVPQRTMGKKANVIAVATESGDDVTLYWTGSGWRVKSQNNIP
jgi:hypothetical protein